LSISVDVIVPCYRYAHFLQGCVETILEQRGVDVRVLIIDDASPDNTEEIGMGLADSDSRVTFRRHQTNRGHIPTFNEGIEWVSAECLLLLSADDYILPQALSRACRLMADAPEVGFVFGNAITRHSDGTEEQVRPLGRKAGTAKSLVMTGAEFVKVSGGSNIVPTPTAVVRTKLQKRLGGYRLELPHSGDMEMWLRLASHAQVGFINEDQGVYRRHDANMSLAYSAGHMLADLKERHKAIMAFLTEAGGTLAADPAVRSTLSEGLARQAIGRASAAFNAGDLDAVDAISAFAQDVCPGIRKSWPWAKLASKRLIGQAGWQAMSSAKSSFSRRF